jgi:NAD(P)-dependent dehydrogenase (short-subunit alcohol dehydrogenase family)
MSNAGGVFITGSSSGIGKAGVLALDKLGYDVFTGVRKMEDGQSLKQIASERLHPVIIDITNHEQIVAAAETVHRGLGEMPLVGIINNAGIAVGGPLEFVPIDRLRHQLEVNLIGHIAVSQVFIPLLRKSRGRIINVGSTAGFFASPLMGAYCSSKYAVEAISDVLRRELRPWNIKVSLIEPGIIGTKIWKKAGAQADRAIKEAPDEMIRLYGPLIELVRKHIEDIEKRAQPPAVVAKAVVHALTAAHPKARYRVGPSARVQKILSWLPENIQDRIIASHIKWGI